MRFLPATCILATSILAIAAARVLGATGVIESKIHPPATPVGADHQHVGAAGPSVGPIRGRRGDLPRWRGAPGAWRQARVAAAEAASESYNWNPRHTVSGAGFPSQLLRGGSRRRDERVRSVLLYFPNLLGYARIALVLTSYYLAETNWKASSSFYLVAFAGDAVDGHVARKFNQASRFGAVLDMVTDRCSTAGLLLVLSRLYDRRHAFAFLVLMFIDMFSHWMHTHSVVDKHHKSTTTLKRRNVLIRTYYDRLPFFAFCCIGTELFYVLLYLLHFMSEESRLFSPLRKLCLWLCLPACALKQLINITQMISAARTLALEELDHRKPEPPNKRASSASVPEGKNS